MAPLTASTSTLSWCRFSSVTRGAGVAGPPGEAGCVVIYPTTTQSVVVAVGFASPSLRAKTRTRYLPAGSPDHVSCGEAEYGTAPTCSIVAEEAPGVLVPATGEHHRGHGALVAGHHRDEWCHVAAGSGSRVTAPGVRSVLQRGEEGEQRVAVDRANVGVAQARQHDEGRLLAETPQVLDERQDVALVVVVGVADDDRHVRGGHPPRSAQGRVGGDVVHRGVELGDLLVIGAAGHELEDVGVGLGDERADAGLRSADEDLPRTGGQPVEDGGRAALRRAHGDELGGGETRLSSVLEMSACTLSKMPRSPWSWR